MVKHVVMWTLKDMSKAEDLKKAIESMKDKVKSLTDIECGINTNVNADCDLVLISTHNSPDDLEAYLIDPIHKEVAALIGPNVNSRHAVDFEY